jgi:hypothetical protein
MRTALTLALMLLLVAPLSAETYRVSVTRIDKDLYRDDRSKVLIETKYCYEYATRDDAVLRWEGRYGTNWIVFSSGTKCDVVGVFSSR